VLRPDGPDDTIEMLAVTGVGAWSVRTPRLSLKANGSGDLTAALFTAHLGETGSPAEALARTASSVYAVLAATVESGEQELRIVAAQDAIAHPPCEFEVERVR
jgi:pyridoxine kinase